MGLNHIIATHLREVADKIDQNTCGLTSSEIKTFATVFMHEEMNKTEASEFLNMSTRTFDRKIENGELPQGKHIRGSKNLIWYKDELITGLGE